MRVNLTELLDGEIEKLEVSGEVAIPKGNGWFPDDVEFTAPAAVTGNIINASGYILIRLHASAAYKSPCARCLTEVSGRLEADIVKAAAVKGTLQNEDTDDYAIIENGQLDLDEAVTDQLSLEFPQKILCREDCKGLCPKCGKNLNEGPCDCPKDEYDPRWEPLRKLLDDEYGSDSDGGGGGGKAVDPKT